MYYNNELTSLSAFSGSKKGYSASGPSFSTYNGKSVADIVKRDAEEELLRNYSLRLNIGMRKDESRMACPF